MPFKWSEFLEVANQLQQQALNGQNPEAFYRSAIGRAYYAAYGHVVEHMTKSDKFKATGKPDDHGKLRACLKGNLDGVRKRLDQLRQWRNDADYDKEYTLDAQAIAAPESIKSATYIVEKMLPG